MPDFGRLVTAMVTPFDSNMQIDLQQLEKLVDYLIEEQQTDSLIVCGTTGESPTLSDEEKLLLFREIVRIAGGRCKVIAGTGSNNTEHAVHLTEAATKAGVDGILLVAPYYNRPSQEGLYRHFKAIAEATNLPVMLYNIPGRTGINIEAETTLRLAETVPNIVATKESHQDLDHITQLVTRAPGHFRVYCGDDPLTLPYMSVGAYGIVSVASHIVGSRMKEMIQAYLNGEPARAAELHRQLHPVFKGMFYCPHRVPSPAPVKYALKVRGVPVGDVRLPLLPVNADEARFIEQLLNNLDQA